MQIIEFVTGGNEIVVTATKPKKRPAPPAKPENNQCGAPSNVNIEGTLVVSTAMAGIASFTGEMTDVATGRKMSFTAKGQILGEGAASFGAGLGHFSVSGTVKGFGALSKPFAIGFATAGWGPLSVGSAKITSNAGSMGNIQVNATLAVPAGASLNQFEGAKLEKTTKGNCP